MGKINLMLVIVFLLMIPISLADLNYSKAGENDGFFIRGSGSFNSQLDPSELLISTVVLSDPEQVPLIKDLDGDGVPEIIVLNDETVTIFQNKSLDIVAVFALNATVTDTFSNMIIFDIDGDNIDEIIIASETRESLQILNYSDSVITQEASIPLTTITHDVSNAGKITIGCESANRCVMTYAESQVVTGADTLSASFFNSTNVANEIALSTTSTFQVFCPAKIRTMAIANYDFQTDSNVEFISSYVRPDLTTGDPGINYLVFYINVESDNTLTLEQTSTITGSDTDEIFAGPGGTFKCDNFDGLNAFKVIGGFGEALPGKFITSPLVYDANPLSAGLETMIGFMVDNNEFAIRMFKSDGTKQRDFPLVQESEGQILSNLFRAEIFDGSTSETDFCVLAQEVSNFDRLSLTCGSLTDTNGFGATNLQTIEFRSDNLGIFNVTDDYNHWGILAHSVQYDESNSVSEVISTWGVLEPDITGGAFSACFLLNNCPLNLIFRNPATIVDGTVVPVDLDDIDKEDLLVLTQNNLFYADDGFSNEGVNSFCGEPGSVTGICSEYGTNPCIDSVWRINTSVEITVTGIDPESDLVQVTATLYDGDSNEQSSVSANVSSGTTVPFSFIANKTIGAGTLTITAVDIVENPLDIQTVTKTFSVAPNGVEFNDCTTLVTGGVDEVDVADVVVEGSFTEDATDNAIVTGINTVIDVSGLAGTTFWLILMLAFSVGIFFRGVNVGLSGNGIIGAIAVVNALFLVLGARIGVLSVGLVTILVVIGVVIVGIFAGRFLVGSSIDAN